MASINSVGSSNLTSSLYNSANVISGLASGLDTEGMIEGLVQSYQKKIQTLSNKVTKTEWKQEAYRNIISKMNSFSSKYTSYLSSTNLMSASFFNNAIKLAGQGKYGDKVAASGRTDSDVKLYGVSQLATAARYTTRSSLSGITDDFSIAAEQGVNFDDTYTMGALSGSLTLTYGGQTATISFDPYKDIIPETKTVTNYDGQPQEVALTDSEKAQELYKMIESKLSDVDITLSNGETKKATDLIDIQFSGGQISFKDKTTGGNNVYFSDSSGNVASRLGLNLEEAEKNKPSVIDTGKITQYVEKTTVGEHISGKTMNISLDGKVKSIMLPKIAERSFNGGDIKKYLVNEENDIVTDENGQPLEVNADNYAKAVQKALDEKFGSGKIKVTNEATDGSLQLKFKAPDNSDMIINTDAGQALGFGNASANYLNTGKTLGDVLPKGTFQKDADGNEIKQDFILNGVKIGSYDSKATIADVLRDINNNTEAGVKAGFSQATRQFTFTSKDTGTETKIEMGDGLAQKMFGKPTDISKLGSTQVKDLMSAGTKISGEKFSVNVDGHEYSFNLDSDNVTFNDITTKLKSQLDAKGDGTYQVSLSESGSLKVTKDDQELSVSTNAGIAQNLFASINGYTKGQDAKFEVEVNGQKMQMTRPSNSANIDGMTLNFKSTFRAEDGEAVTFQRTTDSDKIVDAVRSMVNDYNDVMSAIRGQYATLPYRKSSNGSFSDYDPLTDEDKASMSESAIQAYEEKAKQGLLFGDSNLTALYEKMRSVFTGSTEAAKDLRAMGLTISYSSVDGSAMLSLDESKLRSALDSDPDAVAEAFTSVGGNGTEPGVMQSLKTHLDRYAGLTGATKGILVQQAGTPLSSLSLMNNTWQKEIDNTATEIEKWQDKLSAQVDKYTSMFSKLETLIYQMNSQSSSLAGLMGG